VRFRRRFTIGRMLVAVLFVAAWCLTARGMMTSHTRWGTAWQVGSVLPATALLIACVEEINLVEILTVAAIAFVLTAFLQPGAL
jgi:hypothetical protein